jgi:prolyl oligopeptidase
VALDVPDDADAAFWRERLLIRLKTDWTVGGRTWPRGSLLATDAKAFLAGAAPLRHAVHADGDAVARRLRHHAPPRAAVGAGQRGGPGGGAARAGAGRRHVGATRGEGPVARARWVIAALHDPLLGTRDPLAERYLLTYTDFLTPDTLSLARTGSDERELLKSRPRFFDSDGMRVEQRFATSKDGTRVPYFVVWPRGARADGSNPTLLYGYGGFEQSMQPWYSGAFGSAWYSQGGVLVVANIRGGGEYGPAWHQAAIKATTSRTATTTSSPWPTT